MITVPTKTKGAMDSTSILSINAADPHSVRSQADIMDLVRETGHRPQPAPAHQPPDARPAPSPVRPRPQPGMDVQPALTAGQQDAGKGTPIKRPVPALHNRMQKGQKSPLSTVPVDSVSACFGWNTKDSACDVDVSAFLLGADGKVIGDAWFVFYGQPLSPDQSTRFVPDGAKDRESIEIDLKKLHPDVKKIVFVLTINDALTEHLHFGMLEDAYARILDPSGNELVSFLITEYYTNVVSMMMCELYQHNGAWKFNAVGNGVAKDLAGLCGLYGVQVV